MKTPKQLFDSLKQLFSSLTLPVKILVGALLLTSSLYLFSIGLNSLQRSLLNSTIAAQDAVITKAKEDNLKLAGKLEVVYTELAAVNSQLVEANSQLILASENTNNAKVQYIEVRSGNRPVFVSADTAGKVAELTNKLNSLYPDSPSKP